MNASDFYVVPGLKRRCEDWLIQSLDTTNMVDRLILGGLPVSLHTYKCHMFSSSPCYSPSIRRHLLCGQAAAAGQGDAGGELKEAGADPRLEDEAGGQDRAGPGGARGTGQELALNGMSSPSSMISIILDR